jgi:hypothetical protein
MRSLRSTNESGKQANSGANLPSGGFWEEWNAEANWKNSSAWKGGANSANPWKVSPKPGKEPPDLPGGGLSEKIPLFRAKSSYDD